jgi:bacteriocin-like protein
MCKNKEKTMKRNLDTEHNLTEDELQAITGGCGICDAEANSYQARVDSAKDLDDVIDNITRNELPSARASGDQGLVTKLRENIVKNANKALEYRNQANVLKAAVNARGHIKI